MVVSNRPSLKEPLLGSLRTGLFLDLRSLKRLLTLQVDKYQLAQLHQLLHLSRAE
jgi:hypothetical protein